MKFTLTGVLATILCWGSSACAATEACFLQVDGKTYLNRPCNVERDPDGSLRVGVGSSKSIMFFSYIFPDAATGTAIGWWNGSDGYNKAQTELGTLNLRDGCWVNERAKVCAGSRAASAPQEGARQSAERFVKSLYKPYLYGHMSDLGDARAGPHAADRILAPSLASLWARSGSKKRDEVGPIDGDPICSCQEAGVKNLHYDVINANDSYAVVTASFRLDNESRIVKFDLSSIGGHWFIADISDNVSSKSLKQALLADLNAAR